MRWSVILQSTLIYLFLPMSCGGAPPYQIRLTDPSRPSSVLINAHHALLLEADSVPLGPGIDYNVTIELEKGGSTVIPIIYVGRFLDFDYPNNAQDLLNISNSSKSARIQQREEGDADHWIGDSINMCPSGSLVMRTPQKTLVEACGIEPPELPTFISAVTVVELKGGEWSVPKGLSFKLLLSLRTPKQSAKCPIDWFDCRDDFCVHGSLRCNGYEDCGDGFDEMECSDDSNLSTGEVVAICAGIGVTVSVCLILGMFLLCRKRKRSAHLQGVNSEQSPLIGNTGHITHRRSPQGSLLGREVPNTSTENKNRSESMLSSCSEKTTLSTIFEESGRISELEESTRSPDPKETNTSANDYEPVKFVDTTEPVQLSLDSSLQDVEKKTNA